MADSHTRYPLLSEVLALKNLAIQAMYSNRSFGEIFDVSARSVQNWIAAGTLIPRNLPGRWKFLAQDVEDFLLASRKAAAKQVDDHEIHH